ncbi:hypothetical protein RJ640_006144 [Escallonia rubra]|uniref:F-box domain-containing protein n=1 Tax=Escallonia rubra TaxID=112253 RepID=A0AA88URQ7_9ASTE|nr:hypothetical protein RJ640_006144 [Escallonia rubra]
MKKPGSETGGLLGEDIISRLPNDILLVILDTLSDLKSLLLCRLVSKHFLSLVCQTRHVSLHITSWNPIPVNETSSFDDDTSPHHQLLHQLKQDPSLLIPRAAFLLTHFTRIQSLHVIIHPSGGGSDSFFRWKLEHNSNTFLALFAKTPKTTTTSITTDNEQEEQVVSKLSLEEIARYLDLASYHLVDAEARRSLVVGLHDCSPLNIENFVVTDLEEEGRICLTKEEVVALRKEERRLSMVKFTVWKVLPGKGLWIDEGQLISVIPPSWEEKREFSNLVQHVHVDVLAKGFPQSENRTTKGSILCHHFVSAGAALSGLEEGRLKAQRMEAVQA